MKIGDMNMARKLETENDAPMEKQKTIYILGDSMVKKLNGYLVKVCTFSGAKVSCMAGHVKPTISNENPDHVILHTGANYLRSEKTASQITRSITELAVSLKDNDNSGIGSGIEPRHGNLNNKNNRS